MLEYVKQQLPLRHCSASVDAELESQIAEGEYFLSGYDADIDWNNPNPYIKGLLVIYIRYLRANAKDDFRINYRSDLIDLYHDYVGRHGPEEEKEAGDAESQEEA